MPLEQFVFRPLDVGTATESLREAHPNIAIGAAADQIQRTPLNYARSVAVMQDGSSRFVVISFDQDGVLLPAWGGSVQRRHGGGFGLSDFGQYPLPYDGRLPYLPLIRHRPEVPTNPLDQFLAMFPVDFECQALPDGTVALNEEARGKVQPVLIALSNLRAKFEARKGTLAKTARGMLSDTHDAVLRLIHQSWEVNAMTHVLHDVQSAVRLLQAVDEHAEGAVASVDLLDHAPATHTRMPGDRLGCFINQTDNYVRHVKAGVPAFLVLKLEEPFVGRLRVDKVVLGLLPGVSNGRLSDAGLIPPALAYATEVPRKALQDAEEYRPNDLSTFGYVNAQVKAGSIRSVARYSSGTDALFDLFRVRAGAATAPVASSTKAGKRPAYFDVSRPPLHWVQADHRWSRASEETEKSAHQADALARKTAKEIRHLTGQSQGLPLVQRIREHMLPPASLLPESGGGRKTLQVCRNGHLFLRVQLPALFSPETPLGAQTLTRANWGEAIRGEWAIRTEDGPANPKKPAHTRQTIRRRFGAARTPSGRPFLDEFCAEHLRAPQADAEELKLRSLRPDDVQKLADLAAFDFFADLAMADDALRNGNDGTTSGRFARIKHLAGPLGLRDLAAAVVDVSANPVVEGRPETVLLAHRAIAAAMAEWKCVGRNPLSEVEGVLAGRKPERVPPADVDKVVLAVASAYCRAFRAQFHRQPALPFGWAMT